MSTPLLFVPPVVDPVLTLPTELPRGAPESGDVPEGEPVLEDGEDAPPLSLPEPLPSF